MTEIDRKIQFPVEILKKSVEERLNFFEEVIIDHKKLNDAYVELKQKCLIQKTPLTLVYGPSFVGKSTLLTKFKEDLMESNLPELNKDRGRIAFGYVIAHAPETGNFSWRQLYRGALKSLKEPCVDHKVLPVPASSSSSNDTSWSNKTIDALNESLVSAMRHRKPLVLIIDEGQHIIKLTSSRKYQDQMDVLKSLSTRTSTPIVIAGTNEMVLFRNDSAQLINRSSDVYLSRYHPSKKADVDEFKAIILAMSSFLPVQHIEIDLTSAWRFLHAGSIGCIGTLKNWFDKALYQCLIETNNEGRILTLRHFESTALEESKISQLLEEATQIESKLTEDGPKGYSDTLLAKLGLLGEVEATSSKDKQKKESKVQPKKNARKKNIPGHRKETRDPVGLGSEQFPS